VTRPSGSVAVSTRPSVPYVHDHVRVIVAPLPSFFGATMVFCVRLPDAS